MKYQHQTIIGAIFSVIFGLMALTGYHPTLPPEYIGYWDSGLFDLQGNTFMLGIAIGFGAWAGYAAEMEKASKD
jgi:hypothetical protein